MKDEHQVRIEALKLTQMLGGIESVPARLKFAAQIEQYILSGKTGEALPAPSARAVPVEEGEDPPERPTKRGKRGSGKSGEASEIEQEGETDPAEFGRPSSRASGVTV